MLNRLDGQYLFVLPLPLTAPGKNARLYGVVLCRTDANLNPLSEYEILRCKLPYNALPSPAYLYTLDLNVDLLRDGICESKFINCLKSHFDNKNLTVVTFSARHLQALNAISLRCFLVPDILQKPKSVFDVKTAHKASLHKVILLPTPKFLNFTKMKKQMIILHDLSFLSNFLKSLLPTITRSLRIY